MVLTSTQAPQSHRERLLEGLACSIREQGFRGTKIADVVRHARTSRRTFYEHFADKEACFLELVQATGRLLATEVEAAIDPRAPWEEQIDQAVDAYVEALARDPAITLALTRELPAVGGDAVAVQREGVDRFAELCLRLVDSRAFRDAGVAPLTADSAVMIIGGVNELVVHVVERGDDVAKVGPVAKDAIKAVLRPR